VNVVHTDVGQWGGVPGAWLIIMPPPVPPPTSIMV
jgi:hypothetical protein